MPWRSDIGNHSLCFWRASKGFSSQAYLMLLQQILPGFSLAEKWGVWNNEESQTFLAKPTVKSNFCVSQTVRCVIASLDVFSKWHLFLNSNWMYFYRAVMLEVWRAEINTRPTAVHMYIPGYIYMYIYSHSARYVHMHPRVQSTASKANLHLSHSLST